MCWPLSGRPTEPRVDDCMLARGIWRKFTSTTPPRAALLLILALVVPRGESYRVPMTPSDVPVARGMKDVRGLVRPRPPEEDRPGPCPHEVVSDFKPRAFEPPFFAANPHVQTIWGARAIQELLAKTLNRQPLPRHREWEFIYDRRSVAQTRPPVSMTTSSPWVIW